MHYPIIVLSYHRFNKDLNSYPFSRTYDQLEQDLLTKTFDWITIDDGHQSAFRACDIARSVNIRCKVFINPSTIETPGYLTWDQVIELARYHDIENHGYEHIKLPFTDDEQIYTQIKYSNDLIAEKTGRVPRFFVPPWNRYDDRVEALCRKFKLILLKNRITIKNDTA